MQSQVESVPSGLTEVKSYNKENDLRWILARDLSARCARNPRYSLRSYARFLGVSHALLSLVLNGRRPPSRTLIAKAKEALDLKDLSSLPQHYLPLRAFNRSQEEENYNDDFTLLSMDEYSAISDWHFWAILSLLELNGAKWNASWIASRLGISQSQALSAMNLLEEKKLVQKKRNGQWKQTQRPIKIDNKESNFFTRKTHRQLLTKAMESLENDPMTIRDHSHCTFTMDEKLIPFAYDEITKFRRRLMKKLESKGNPTRVYELCVQLFPVSKGVKE